MQTYEQYKDSGIDWIGEIPEHWEMLKVKKIFKLVAEPAHTNNNYELLSVYTDIGVKPRKELEEKGNKASTTDGYWKVKKGDFIVNKLLAWMGAIGVSNYDGVTSPAYDILRNKKPIIHNYYHELFRNKVFIQEMKKYSKGIMEMRLRLYFDKFGDINIPFPPIHEQEAIANFLDDKTAKIDVLVQTKEQQIEKLKELRQAKIHQAVTKGLDANAPTKDSGVEWIGEIPAHWELEKFKYLGFIFPGLNGKKGDDFNKENFEGAKEFVPFTTIFNFSQIKDERFQYVKISPNEIQNKVEKNDLLFLMSSETLNDIAKSSVYLLDKSSYLNSFCKGFRITSTKLNSIFTNYLLSSKNYRNYYELCGRGFTRINIKQEYINDTIITLPPIQEQEQIVAYLDEVTGKIDQAIAQKKEQIAKLKEYKQSLINDVVTGKVRVC